VPGIRRVAAPGYALLLAVLIAAPLLTPGYLLLRDAVSTPRSYLSDAALGVTDAAPRAVPQDFLIAVASRLLDGGMIVKALLVVGLWLAGWGASHLVAAVLPEAGLPGRLVAVTVAIWNPYVAERLLQGHWSLLVGYGCLPWVAAAMVRLRDEGRGVSALAFFTALAGLTPTGLMMASTTALACVAVPGAGWSRARSAATALGLAVLAALPWLTASASTGSLSAYRASGTPGFAEFAARAEPGLGTLGSLAGLGGIWNSEAVPASRSTLFAAVATAILLGVVAAGLPPAARRRGARPLLALAAVAVAAPAVAATGAGAQLLHHVVVTMPGLGVLRDGQKWVALAMPGYAVAAAGIVVTLRRWHPAAVGAVACAAVLVVLPDLAWGAWRQVGAVRYPPGWSTVAAAINADPRPVAVLPADSARRFAWAGPAPVLDPLPRWLRADVLTSGDLTVSGRRVPGEGEHARTVGDLLLAGATPDRLREEGVGWVVAELGSLSAVGGGMGDAAATLAELPIVYRDGDLALYRVGGSAVGATDAQRRAALAAHIGWLAMLAAGAAAMARDFAAASRAGG
jgi:hypothetical protein